MSRATCFVILCVVLLLNGTTGKQDEREKRKDIVDMAFCGEEDCYQVLNISSDSTRGEVKRGYHRMSLLYHPDKLGDKSEEEQAEGNALFIKVAQAYAVLSDEESRRKYDMWVRGGRRRRPEPGDDMGPMPAYYRDDSVRDVQDTPVAFAAVAVTLLISIGLPFCLSMQGKSRKPRRPQVEKKEKSGELAAQHISRRERRGERDNRETPSRLTPQTADIAAVVTTEGIGTCGASNKKPAITKVSGPWSPEEEAELIKAVAKFPGGTVERWAKIADLVGSRSEEDCMTRAAALKGIAHNRTGGGNGAAGGGTQKGDARSAYSASQSGSGRGQKALGNAPSREEMAKMSVTDFAKLVKEKEREKMEREKEKEKEKEKETEKSKDRSQSTGTADEKSEGRVQDKPWTPVEQSLLENAMRSVDKSLADRWDRIAEMVPNRSRKEVIARVKDLKKMLAASAQE